jgi:ABC-type uncharacterized transport system fused permease/ATPase subunit
VKIHIGKIRSMGFFEIPTTVRKMPRAQSKIVFIVQEPLMTSTTLRTLVRHEGEVPRERTPAAGVTD